MVPTVRIAIIPGNKEPYVESRHQLLLGAVVLALCTAPGPAAGQTVPENRQQEPLFDTRNPKYETSLDKLYQERSVLRNQALQVLDHSLDPAEYAVGPGDVFQFIIWGGRDARYEVEVNPLGTVVLPTVGEIDVGGFTLERALGLMKARIRENYANIDYSLNLVGLRRFRVYVTGQVAEPGTYFVQGSDRVADVITLVGGVSQWADATAVEVRREGETGVYDLTAFRVSGDKTQNPVLRGGDVVHVPPIDLQSRYVFFEGTLRAQQDSERELNRILRPEELPSELQGIFPLKEGETLSRFLLRIGAVARTSNLGSITVFRSDEAVHFDLLDSEALERFMSFELAHKDRVVVRDRRDRVYVRGEVRQPGAYPYLADRTTSDYAGVAGVMDSGADPDDYYVLRADTGDKVKGKGVAVHNGDTVVIPQRGRENFKDYVQILFPIASLALSVIALASR